MLSAARGVSMAFIDLIQHLTALSPESCSSIISRFSSPSLYIPTSYLLNSSVRRFGPLTPPIPAPFFSLSNQVQPILIEDVPEILWGHSISATTAPSRQECVRPRRGMHQQAARQGVSLLLCRLHPPQEVVEKQQRERVGDGESVPTTATTARS
mgnify:CR=1 FL=1